jgi:hypothetical protein
MTPQSAASSSISWRISNNRCNSSTICMSRFIFLVTPFRIIWPAVSRNTNLSAIYTTTAVDTGPMTEANACVCRWCLVTIVCVNGIVVMSMLCLLDVRRIRAVYIRNGLYLCVLINNRLFRRATWTKRKIKLCTYINDVEVCIVQNVCV